MSAIKDMLKLPPNMITSVISTLYFRDGESGVASKAAAEYVALVGRVEELERILEDTKRLVNQNRSGRDGTSTRPRRRP